MDLTQLFKASVKTVRLRYKTLPEKNRILKTKHRDDFLFKANNVRYQVTQLRDLLIENRPAYMRFGYHLKTATQMTESERDIIDNESEKIVVICDLHVTDLRTSILKNNEDTNKQLNQHKLAILDILSNYLKNIHDLHNEQKKTRITHGLETLKLLKLRKNDMKSYESKMICSSVNNDNEKNSTETGEDRRRADLAFLDDSTDDELAIQFEFENCQILSDFKDLTDEVEQIGKHVTGIAKLQEIFTEKVYKIL